MTVKTEFDRIQTLDIASVKMELHFVNQAISMIAAGGNSSLNTKKMMLKIRLGEIENGD